LILKELVEVLPDSLDITVEHDKCKTGSLVCGIKQFDRLLERKVIKAIPIYYNRIDIQSFYVKVE
jgi:hypothetical protein